MIMIVIMLLFINCNNDYVDVLRELRVNAFHAEIKEALFC
jgi:hypothetical protein